VSQTILNPAAAATSTGGRTSRPQHLLVRLAAAAALGVTSAAHIPVAVDHLSEVPYLGWAFCAFIVLTAAGAGSLLVEDRRWVWRTMGALNAAAVLVFVTSRVVGLPGASDDRGAWTDPSARVALAAEFLVVVLTAWVLRPERETSPPASR